jgi:hypothetical protein
MLRWLRRRQPYSSHSFAPRAKSESAVYGRTERARRFSAFQNKIFGRQANINSLAAFYALYASNMKGVRKIRSSRHSTCSDEWYEQPT